MIEEKVIDSFARCSAGWVTPSGRVIPCARIQHRETLKEADEFEFHWNEIESIAETITNYVKRSNYTFMAEMSLYEIAYANGWTRLSSFRNKYREAVIEATRLDNKNDKVVQYLADCCGCKVRFEDVDIDLIDEALEVIYDKT